MDIRNIYELNAIINLDGSVANFDENYPLCRTYIAECKTKNEPGYSFYAFYVSRVDQNMHKNSSGQMIKLENLIYILENPKIELIKMNKELKKYEYLKDYFITSYRHQEALDNWIELERKAKL